MSEETDGFVDKIFKSGVLLFVGQILELGLSFAAVIVVARYLGPTGYGAIVIGVTVVNTLLPFVLLGLPTGIARFLPRYEELTDRQDVVLSAFSLPGAVSLFAGAAIFIFADTIAVRIFHDTSVAPVLRIFAIALPFAALRDLSLGVVKGLQESVPKVLIRNISFPGLRLLGAVVAVLFGVGAITFAWVYVLPFLAVGVVSFGYLLKTTPLFERRIFSPVYRELIGFSAPLMLSGVMQRVLRDLDTFVLGYFGNTAAVGIYNGIYPLAMIPIFVLTSFSYVFLPVISELHADNRIGDMTNLYQLVTKWVFFGTLPLLVPLAVFPRTVIGITFGKEYISGAVALSILAIGYAFSSLLGPNSEALTSVGSSRVILYVNFAAAVVNFVANVLLIPRYGLVGAATATAVSYFVMNILFSYQLYRETGIHPVTRTLVKPGIGAFVLIFAVYVISKSVEIGIIGVTVLYLVFLVVYGVCLLALGAVEGEEVRLVLQFEDRFNVDLDPLKRVAKLFFDDIPE